MWISNYGAQNAYPRCQSVYYYKAKNTDVLHILPCEFVLLDCSSLFSEYPLWSTFVSAWVMAKCLFLSVLDRTARRKSLNTATVFVVDGWCDSKGNVIRRMQAGLVYCCRDNVPFTLMLCLNSRIGTYSSGGISSSCIPLVKSNAHR